MIDCLDKDYIYFSEVVDIYIEEFDNFYKEIIVIKKGNLKFFDYSGFERKIGKVMLERIINKLLEEDEEKIDEIFFKLII